MFLKPWKAWSTTLFTIFNELSRKTNHVRFVFKQICIFSIKNYEHAYLNAMTSFKNLLGHLKNYLNPLQTIMQIYNTFFIEILKKIA